MLNYWKYLIYIFPIKFKVGEVDSHIQIVPNMLQCVPVSELSMLNLKLGSPDLMVTFQCPAAK